MVLSNTEIIRCLEAGLFSIDPIAGRDPAEKPFNTSAVDLRLSNEILIPEANEPIQLDLNKPGITGFLRRNSRQYIITEETPYSLKKDRFILALTHEKVSFPINNELCYCARVEGKSSIARCGVLVHFTAPTIHVDFSGPIALEILNLGPNDFLLTPLMYICQLIIEEVKGCPMGSPNQFTGQNSPAGVINK